MANLVEEVTVSVRDFSETGWWVSPKHWFEQEVFPLTGCWSIVRLKGGKVTRACILAGYDGWHDGNYSPVNVQSILKPSRWFDSPNDMRGKVEEYKAYKHERLYARQPNVLREVQ
jgi:hypothetical protein